MTLSQRLKLNSSSSNNIRDPWCRRSSVVRRKANNGPCRRRPCPMPRAISILITPGPISSSLPQEWPPHHPSQYPRIPVNSCWGLIGLRLRQSRMCISQPKRCRVLSTIVAGWCGSPVSVRPCLPIKHPLYAPLSWSYEPGRHRGSLSYATRSAP